MSGAAHAEVRAVLEVFAAILHHAHAGSVRARRAIGPA